MRNAQLGSVSLCFVINNSTQGEDRQLCRVRALLGVVSSRSPSLRPRVSPPPPTHLLRTRYQAHSSLPPLSVHPAPRPTDPRRRRRKASEVSRWTPRTSSHPRLLRAPSPHVDSETHLTLEMQRRPERDLFLGRGMHPGHAADDRKTREARRVEMVGWVGVWGQPACASCSHPPDPGGRDPASSSPHLRRRSRPQPLRRCAWSTLVQRPDPQRASILPASSDIARRSVRRIYPATSDASAKEEGVIRKQMHIREGPRDQE